MDGYTWVFETGKHQLGETLMHPVHGSVWNTTVGSEVHERGLAKGQCRCNITYEVDLGDLVERVKQIHAVVLQMTTVPEGGK